jgi:hypothetical protein
VFVFFYAIELPTYKFLRGKSMLCTCAVLGVVCGIWSWDYIVHMQGLRCARTLFFEPTPSALLLCSRSGPRGISREGTRLLRLPVCLSLYLSFACLFVPSLSAPCLSVGLPVGLPPCLSVCLPVLPACLPACQSACLLACLSAYPSA